MDQALADAGAVVDEIFGTPDAPRWPEYLNEQANLASLERLRRAAGAVGSDEQGRHFGLYREHCTVCHGTNGDGLGPTAALLNPYPRNFRMGKFKFKSTPIGQKPTRNDLRSVLEHGIVGTSMPSFAVLDDDDLEALVDYIIYLSIRGELERRLLTEAALELDLDEDERLYNPAWRESDPEQFGERWQDFEAQVKRIALSWQTADSKVLQVQEPPSDLPVGRLGEVASAGDSAGGDVRDQLVVSIDRGRQLFQGNIASCAFCHGMQGRGDGQQNNYDEWTRDWTQGFDPRNLDQLGPLLELGALRPRNIQPRNLQLGVFRGGNDPQDLYTRIVNGIEGTPMPAAPMKPANPQGLTNADVWDIVNYLLNLPETAGQEVTAFEAKMAAGKEIFARSVLEAALSGKLHQRDSFEGQGWSDG